jgi:hypothetical protein
MSAGNFTLSTYQTGEGNFVPIEVQPETLQATFGAATNDPGAGPIDDGFPTAYAKGSRRRNGIHARRVTVRFTADVPTGYTGQALSVPILTSALFTAIAKGTTGTYLGEAIVVSSKQAEVIV